MITALSKGNKLMDYLHFDDASFWEARNNEIDPFTVMAIFNRGMTAGHREQMAHELALLFHVDLTPPTEFHGIAHLDPRNSIYTGPEQIWRLFIAGLNSKKDEEFQIAWNGAMEIGHNGLAMLSIALFWINPLKYLPVDSISSKFIKTHSGLNSPDTHASGLEYVRFMEAVENKLSEYLPWPRLAYSAWAQVHAKSP